MSGAFFETFVLGEIINSWSKCASHYANRQSRRREVSLTNLNFCVITANMQSNLIAFPNTFLFSEASHETPSVFEVEFIAGNMVYEYGFELLNEEVLTLEILS